MSLTRGLTELIARLETADLVQVPVEDQADVIFQCLERAELPRYERVSDFALALIQAQIRSGITTNEKGRISLWSTPHYTIEAFVWGNRDTNVHNHSFTGALQVLSGESLNLNFSFEAKGGDEEFRWGDLRCQTTSSVRAGDRFQFRAGSDFIHRVIHLSAESISLRVVSLVGAVPPNQWLFRAGHLAFREVPDLLLLLLDWSPLLETIYRNNRREFERSVNELFAAGYRWGVVNFLTYLIAKYDDREGMAGLLSRSPHFTDAEKEAVIPRLAAMAVEMIPVRGARYSADTELFLSLLTASGFGAELHRTLKILMGETLKTDWVCQRLVEMSTGGRIESAAAQFLLDRFCAWDRVQKVSDSGFPLPTHWREGWKVEQFEGFLERCR